MTTGICAPPVSERRADQDRKRQPVLGPGDAVDPHREDEITLAAATVRTACHGLMPATTSPAAVVYATTLWTIPIQTVDS